jgi:hypothetical protein
MSPNTRYLCPRTIELKREGEPSRCPVNILMGENQLYKEEPFPHLMREEIKGGLIQVNQLI